MITFSLLLPPDADQADADSLLGWLRDDPDLRGRLSANESYLPSAGAMGDPASIVVMLDSASSSPALARALFGWMLTRPDRPVLTVSTVDGREARLDPGSAALGIERRLSIALAEAAGQTEGPPIMTQPHPSWPDPAGPPRQRPGVPPSPPIPRQSQPSTRQPRPDDLPRPRPQPEPAARSVPPRGPRQGPPRGPQQGRRNARLPDRASSTAILIGVSDYTHPALPDLPTVQDSLHVLADVLTDFSRGGFATERCLVLDNPSLREVSDAIAEAGRTTTDTIFVYFAGHLVVAGSRTYLAMRTTDPSRPWSSALPLEDIRLELERSGAVHRLLVLDGVLPSDRASFGTSRQALSRIEVDQGVALVISSGSRDFAGGAGTAFTGQLLMARLRSYSAGPSLFGLDEVYQGLRPKLSGPDDFLHLKSRDRDTVGLLRIGSPSDSWIGQGPGYPTSAVSTILPVLMPRFTSVAEARRRLARAWRSTVVAVRDVLDLSLPDRSRASVVAGLAVDRSWARLEDQLDQLTREIGPPFDADDDPSRGPRD